MLRKNEIWNEAHCSLVRSRTIAALIVRYRKRRSPPDDGVDTPNLVSFTRMIEPVYEMIEESMEEVHLSCLAGADL